MKISVIVPNFNNGTTLERTLKSLLSQEYADLEIIVIDGGSKDDSIDIIKRYEPHLAYWVSEKDKGQSQAINKGFARATGEVVNWLCSDDYLTPGALERVAREFREFPETDVVSGAYELDYIHEKARNRTVRPEPASLDFLTAREPIGQPSCFYRRRLLDRTPPLREDLHFTMDHELWHYFVRAGAKWRFVPEVLSIFEMSANNKTAQMSVKSADERLWICQEYQTRPGLIRAYRKWIYPMDRWRATKPNLFRRGVMVILKVKFAMLMCPWYGFRTPLYLAWV